MGWEYVWHCHILSHEEMDMMRPVTVHVPRALPVAPVLTNPSGFILNWTDGTPVNYLNPASWTLTGAAIGTAEIGYRIERATLGANGILSAFTVVNTAIANSTTFTDPTASVARAVPVPRGRVQRRRRLGLSDHLGRTGSYGACRSRSDSHTR